MNTIVASSFDTRFAGFLPRTKRTIARVLSFLSHDSYFVEVSLVNSRQMRSIYKKAGKDKVTDVLSFPEPKGFIHPHTKFVHIGEIYLNMEMTTDYPDARSGLRQNRRGRLSRRKGVHETKANWSMDFLLVHGLLHLLGYDHIKKGDIIKMEAIEQLLIERLKNSR